MLIKLLMEKPHLELKLFLLSLLIVPSVFAGAHMNIRGRVLRIDDGQVQIQSVDGTVFIHMAQLSREDVRKVLAANGSKDQIQLSLSPKSLFPQDP